MTSNLFDILSNESTVIAVYISMQEPEGNQHCLIGSLCSIVCRLDDLKTAVPVFLSRYFNSELESSAASKSRCYVEKCLKNDCCLNCYKCKKCFIFQELWEMTASMTFNIAFLCIPMTRGHSAIDVGHYLSDKFCAKT